MELELRTVELDELDMETRADGAAVIRGYAAVFDKKSVDLGGFREVIKPGAFAKSLANDVRALWNHDSSYVMGRTTTGTLRLEEDARGLRVEIDPPDTQWARDAMVSIRRGDVNQMSFGFTVPKDGDIWEQSPRGGILRTLEQVNLLEVSPVAFAAYPQTTVSVRAQQQADAVGAAMAAEAMQELQERAHLETMREWFELNEE